jgi:hypothetical protein
MVRGLVGARTVEAGNEAGLDRTVALTKTIGIVDVAALAARAAYGFEMGVTAT